MSVFQRSEDVFVAVVQRLGAITIENGCETDIGLSVFRGRRRIPAQDEVPCVFLISGIADPREQSRDGLVKMHQPYVVWGFNRCDPDNPEAAAHQMIRDIKRAVWGGERNLNDRVKDIVFDAQDIGPRADGVALVQVEVRFTVEYVEHLRNP